MDDQDQRTDMPDHERDPDDAVGGGLMSSGGTVVDRGTGDRGAGGASRSGTGEDPEGGLDAGMIPGPPAGGAQAYVPAITDDDEQRSVPDA